MPALTDLVTVIPPDGDEQPEDIFAFAAGLIFPDDTRNLHGDERCLLVYKSASFGDIHLRTADPVQNHDRQLFAHYLWNAGIKMAECISAFRRSHEPEEEELEPEPEPDDAAPWSVKGRRVLELGAGGVASPISTTARTKNWLTAIIP